MSGEPSRNDASSDANDSSGADALERILAVLDATVVQRSSLMEQANHLQECLRVAQALHDIRPDLFPTPKDLGLDKIGFFV